MEKAQMMSDSEKEIMKLVWDNGGSIFIADLLERVEETEKDWKRTTVRTFVTRLMEKGLLKAERHGKLCEYTALMTESEYMAEQAKAFVNDVFGGSVKNLMASLFGQNQLKRGELEELERFWEESKGEMK